jgi:hypothetical protein
VSAYVTLNVPMIDEASLLAALSDLGFAGDRVEVHSEAVALVGYGGEARAQRAHIVVRRQHVGTSSNDIGFERTPTGYRAHVSEYDAQSYGAGWMSRLRSRYDEHHRVALERLAAEERRREEERRAAERRALVEAQRQAIHEKAKKLGYRVEEAREGEQVRLVLRKRVF